MMAISLPGSAAGAELLWAVAVVVPVLARRRVVAGLMALTITGAALTQMLKWIVARPRPTADLVEVYRQVAGASFPSGHVVHYVVFFGVIGYLALQSWRRAPRGGPHYIALLVLLLGCSGLLLLIGP